MTLLLLQANLQHSAGASAALISRIIEENIFISLIQEPWVNKTIKGLYHKSTTTVCDHKVKNPRAAIVINKKLNFLPLNNHIHRDLATIQVTIRDGEVTRDVIIASAYFPGNDPISPPPNNVKQLINFCKNQDLPFIIGCDDNSHHTTWGSSNNNARGNALFDYLNDVDAIVLNEGDSPTYFFNGREEVLDITLADPSISSEITNWHVSDTISLSDHNHILFKLNADTDRNVIRKNPRHTDWDHFMAAVAVKSNYIPLNFSNQWELNQGASTLFNILTEAFNAAHSLSRLSTISY